MNKLAESNQGQIVGQRVSWVVEERERIPYGDGKTFDWGEMRDVTKCGFVVAFTSAATVSDAWGISDRNHVVVQGDDGSFHFLRPSQPKVAQ